MNSRACYFLQRDLQQLKENKYTGITALPVSEDMMEWEAEIEGLENTVWHGILFPLTIKFTEEYNLVPPKVTFKVIPFHPNVSEHTGQPCIDFLDNPRKWKTRYTLSSILLTIQVMLSNPVLERPVNLEAAQILTENEDSYNLIIQRLFRDSLQLEDNSFELSKVSDKFIRAIKISFDDYYKTWSEIATSKPAECYRTPLLEDPSFVGQYKKWKKMERKHKKEWNLMYAAARAQYTKETHSPYKANDQSGRMTPCPTPDSQTGTDTVSKTNESEKSELWEDEVQDLVSWAHTLDTHTLED